MIPPEPGPDPPGPDPPTPTPTYNDWEYLSTTIFHNNRTVYVDVGSASDSFVGVVTVGLTGGANWYSDGSLIYLDNIGKYYPFNRTSSTYYDYVDNRLMVWNSDKERWDVQVYNPTVFDQVPVDFISYLQSGNFTLVQG